MANNMSRQDVITYGAIGLLFFSVVLPTWESRQYNSTQRLEDRVADLENNFTSLSGKVNTIDTNIQKILSKMEVFERSAFNGERLSEDFEEFTKASNEENLRQWARINDNEESVDKLEERLADFIAASRDRMRDE